MADEDTKTIGFRVDAEDKREFERTIARARGEGVLDLETDKSDLLRQAMHEIQEDLEYRIEEARKEGNPETTPIAAD